MKKIFAVLLTAVLLCGVMPLTASAAQGNDSALYSVLVLNGSISNNNSGGPIGVGSFAEDTIITISFYPPVTGLTGGRFVQWNTEPSIVFVDGTSETDAIAKFIMPNKDVNIRAEYETVWLTLPDRLPPHFWSTWPPFLQWILRYVLFGWLWMRWL